jgi:hypothetical protein
MPKHCFQTPVIGSSSSTLPDAIGDGAGAGVYLSAGPSASFFSLSSSILVIRACCLATISLAYAILAFSNSLLLDSACSSSTCLEALYLKPMSLSFYFFSNFSL